MRYNLFDEDYGRYSEVVVQDRLNTHINNKASPNELGHVKIDGVTISENQNGTIEISEDFKTSIQDRLDDKANLVHEHISSDITDLNDTIESIVDGKVENLVNKNITNTITFLQVGSVINGLLEVYYALPIKMKVNEISILLGVVSSEDLEFNIEKSNDFNTWSNVFNEPLKVLSDSHYYLDTVKTTVELEKNTFLRVRIINSNQTARDMSINITGTKA